MLLGGGGLLIVLLTMVEIAPIKFNPWSALAKGIGRAINAEMPVSYTHLTLPTNSRV